MIEASSDSGLHQQFWCRLGHQKIKRHDSLSSYYGILWLGIRHQQPVFHAEPGISKTCAMKHKSTTSHELMNFLQGRRTARESRLGSDDAQRLPRSIDSVDLPVERELLIDESDAFQILLLRGKTIRAELSPKLTSMSGLGDTHASLRQPYFMLRAPCLSKAMGKYSLLQLLRHNRFQRGNAEAVSRPTDSNTRICAIHSVRVMGFWFWRYSATRLRSAARLCSMVSAPMAMV